MDVVMCLSTMVRNDTLQEVKEQRVSLKCRKQLRVEEVEMVSLLCKHPNRCTRSNVWWHLVANSMIAGLLP